MSYVRLFEDKHGTSHFEGVELELSPMEYSPPAPAQKVSRDFPARKLLFVTVPADWNGEWHPSPCRQFMAVLAGELEIEAGDGEIRILRAGEVLLGEDLLGRGHQTRALTDVSVVMIQLR